MEKNFKEKLLDEGFSENQIEKLENLFLTEMEASKAADGKVGVCYCYKCHTWVPEEKWEEHPCNQQQQQQ